MSAHKNFFQTSDFITYSMILISLMVEFLFPTNLPINNVLSIVIGISLFFISWTIIFITKYQFKKHNQKSGPNNETTKIIKAGIFSHTRNPIYLGVIFLLPALGFIINSIWLILAIIPVYYLIHFLLILPEEKYLEDRFGDEYRDYADRVRRWI